MIILGILLIIFGSGSLYWGSAQNNSLESQLISMFEKGTVNPGTPFIIIGGIGLAIGLIFLLVSLIKKRKQS